MDPGEGRGRGGGCHLPQELLVEVLRRLRRLPFKFFCRFRCVSRSWRDLSTHPDHLKELPQDLAGLLYTNHSASYLHGDFAVRFAPAGTSPSPGLGFLPCGARALPLDCCSGLLLCRGGGCYYVCNPATGMWTTIPEPASGFQALALAAVQPHGASPRFHVLNFARTEPVRSVFFDVDFEEPDDGNLSDGDGDDELFDLLHWESQWYVRGLEAFSSETGKWVPTNFGLESRVRLVEAMGSVILNGYVHLLTHEKVLAVEPEGQAWRLIPLPGSSWFGLVGCLGQSQECLHYAVQEDGRGAMLQVWVLKDFCKENWMLKHCSAIEVAPQTRLLFDHASNTFCNETFYVVLFHPDTDIVFLPVEGYKLLSYNLINAEVKEICKLEPETRPRFLVYVPSYVNFVQS